MRIIAGKNQRKQIYAPSKLPVRPTTDMAKEALFNILNNHFDFENIHILDLFAGTGNISYEFASRGALEVLSVDNNKFCHSFIKNTSEELDFPNLHAIRSDVFNFLDICKSKFDIIFADPPFDSDFYDQVVKSITEKKLLKDDGWFILEHNSNNKFNDHPMWFDERRYGKVHFSFFG